MSSKRTQVARILREALSAEMDEFMDQHGFRRRVNSLKYSRRLPAVDQVLDFAFDLSPRYEPDAVAHLLPDMTVSMHEVNRIATDMAGSHAPLPPDMTGTIWQQIHSAAPKAQTGNARWFIYNPDSAFDCVIAIRSFVERWVIPVFDEYSSVESLVAVYENNDPRIVRQRHTYLYIAAAYLLMGQRNKAREVLEAKLGQRRPRKEFAKAFEYVGIA